MRKLSSPLGEKVRKSLSQFTNKVYISYQCSAWHEWYVSAGIDQCMQLYLIVWIE